MSEIKVIDMTGRIHRTFSIKKIFVGYDKSEFEAKSQ